MRDIILNFPKQIPPGISVAGSVAPSKPYRRIISCGMGGSQVPAEILSMVKDNVLIHWDYDLPPGADNADLIICTSWSGNTEETVSSYKMAIERKFDTIVIAGGGELVRLAQENKTPEVVLPQDNIPPRTATGYMTGAVFSVLGMANQLPVNLDASQTEDEGKKLAEKIGKKTPLIYSAYPWRRLTGFWKMAFNENTKVPAFSNWFPSAAHFELASLQSKNAVKDYHPVVIRDSEEDSRHARNLDALLAIFDKLEYNYSIVKLQGGKPLEKVFNNYILGLWTSFYLAQKNGTDPVDTSFIEEFKALKKK